MLEAGKLLSWGALAFQLGVRDLTQNNFEVNYDISIGYVVGTIQNPHICTAFSQLFYISVYSSQIIATTSSKKSKYE